MSGNASIRQLVGVWKDIERATGEEFYPQELGERFCCRGEGIAAEHKALKEGCGSHYPLITGIPEVKHWGSEFVRAFIGLDIPPDCIVPTVGSMQAAFALNLTISQFDKERDTVLFIDPCFPVQKQQCAVIGVRWRRSMWGFRGEAFGEDLERHSRRGALPAVLFSNPNNLVDVPAERELEILGACYPLQR